MLVRIIPERRSRITFPKFPDFEFEAPTCVLCKKPIAKPGEAHMLMEGICHMKCMEAGADWLKESKRGS